VSEFHHALCTCRASQAFLADNPDIDLIELFILDANGVPRGKLLHRDELLAVYETGRPLPSTILGLTLNGDDVENSGLVWDVGDIDCRAYPLEGSLVRLPWRRCRPRRCRSACTPAKACPPASPTRAMCCCAPSKRSRPTVTTR
jgi:glutamine synthetase